MNQYHRKTSPATISYAKHRRCVDGRHLLLVLLLQLGLTAFAAAAAAATARPAPGISDDTATTHIVGDLIVAASNRRQQQHNRGHGADGLNHDHDIGYVKKSDEKGGDGYEHFESFHDKDGDAYGYEKHEAFGGKGAAKKKNGAKGKSAWISSGGSGKGEHRSHYKAPQQQHGKGG